MQNYGFNEIHATKFHTLEKNGTCFKIDLVFNKLCPYFYLTIHFILTPLKLIGPLIIF